MDNKIQIKNCIETFNKNNDLDFKIMDFEIFILGKVVIALKNLNINTLCLNFQVALIGDKDLVSI